MLVEKTYKYIYYEMEKDCCRNAFKLKMTVYSVLINTHTHTHTHTHTYIYIHIYVYIAKLF